MIKEFSVSYELNGHELRKIKLGGAIPNDICSQVRYFLRKIQLFEHKSVNDLKIQANIDWSREKFSLVGSKPDWAGIERVSRLIRREHSTFSIYSSHVDPVVSLSTLIKTAPHIQTSKSLSQERSMHKMSR